MCVRTVCTDSHGHVCEGVSLYVMYVLIHDSMCVCVCVMYVLILVGMHVCVCVCTICTNSRGHVCEGVSMCIRRLEVNIEILLNNLLPYPCCFRDRISH